MFGRNKTNGTTKKTESTEKADPMPTKKSGLAKTALRETRMGDFGDSEEVGILQSRQPQPLERIQNVNTSIFGVRAAKMDDILWGRIQSESIKVLTADERSRYYLGETLRTRMAFLASGDLLVIDDDNKSSYVNHILNLTRTSIGENPLQVTMVYICTESQIQDVYTRYEREAVRDVERGESMVSRSSWSEAQKDLILIFKNASQMKASDVHLRYAQNECMLRFRIDGRMEYQRTFSIAEVEEIFNVAHAACEDTEGGHRIASQFQLGRIAGYRIDIPPTVDSIRLQFDPLASSGQLAIFRLLYRDSVDASMDLDHLGYANFQMAPIHKMRQNPTGLVIISGVTGSGKSTTLQKSLLALIAERGDGINVITIENPPEYHIKGAQQLPVVQGDTSTLDVADGFARAIKAALRSDPDVIMIGEIRDKASAELGIEAVRTGHQVWATLHAVSAIRSLERMIGLGVPLKDISSTDMVNGLIAQRLIPKLCPECSLPWKDALKKGMFSTLTPNTETTFEKVFKDASALEILYSRVKGRNPETTVEGCGKHPGCRNGYIGRSVVAETLVPSDKFFQVYIEGGDLGTKKAEAYWLEKEGGVLMAEHCLIKSLCGTVDPADLYTSVGFREQSLPAKRMEKLLSLVETEWEEMQNPKFTSLVSETSGR